MNILLDYRFWLYLALLLTFTYIAMLVLARKSKHVVKRTTQKVAHGKEADKLVETLKPSTEGNERTVRLAVDETGKVHGVFENDQDIKQAIMALREQRDKTKKPNEIRMLTIAIQRLMLRLDGKEDKYPYGGEYVFSAEQYLKSLLSSDMPPTVKVLKVAQIYRGLHEMKHGVKSEHVWFMDKQHCTMLELNEDYQICDPSWLVLRSEFRPISPEAAIELIKNSNV